MKTPGGRAVFQTLKKKAKGPHCGDCSSVDLYNAIERRESVCLKKQNFEVNCSALLSFVELWDQHVSRIEAERL